MVDAGTAASVLGALGLGSVLGQYVSSGSQRRAMRSEVLRALSIAESARWVGPETRPSFVESMRQLEAAALIARVPRSLVAHYKLAATAAHWWSQADFNDHEDENGGSIPIELADVATDAARELSRAVWSPWLSRLLMRRRLHVARARVQAIVDKPASSDDRYTGARRTAEFLARAQGQVD